MGFVIVLICKLNRGCSSVAEKVPSMDRVTNILGENHRFKEL